MGLFSRKPPADKKPTENRKYIRTGTSLRVNYQVANEAQHYDCRIKDISEKGIRFGLYQKLQPGTGIKLWIYLEDNLQPLCVIGRLAWIEEVSAKQYPYEAGIEFEVFDPSLRAKIQEHIQTIAKQGE